MWLFDFQNIVFTIIKYTFSFIWKHIYLFEFCLLGYKGFIYYNKNSYIYCMGFSRDDKYKVYFFKYTLYYILQIYIKSHFNIYLQILYKSSSFSCSKQFCCNMIISKIWEKFSKTYLGFIIAFKNFLLSCTKEYAFNSWSCLMLHIKMIVSWMFQIVSDPGIAESVAYIYFFNVWDVAVWGVITLFMWNFRLFVAVNSKE